MSTDFKIWEEERFGSALVSRERVARDWATHVFETAALQLGGLVELEVVKLLREEFEKENKT